MLCALTAMMQLITPPSAMADHPSPILPIEQSDTPYVIVCLGDSITGVYHHTGNRGSWPEILTQELKTARPDFQFRLINAGVSGNTTEDALARLERDVLQHRPDLTIIALGMNDAARFSEESYSRNMHELIQRTKAIGSDVLLVSPNAVSLDGTLRDDLHLQTIARRLENIARTHNAPFVNAYTALATIRDENPPEWAHLMSDDIHPNYFGHTYLASLILRRLMGVDHLPPHPPPPLFLLRNVPKTKPLIIKCPQSMVTPTLKAIGQARPNAKVNLLSLQTDHYITIEEMAEKIETHWDWKADQNSDKPIDLVILTLNATIMHRDLISLRRSLNAILSRMVGFSPGGTECALIMTHSSASHPRSMDEVIACMVDVADGHRVPRLVLSEDTQEADAKFSNWLLSLLEAD